MARNVVLGICGGIAAYKAAELASLLVKKDVQVYPVMTRNACEFIAPLTLRTLCNRPVATGMFAAPEIHEIEHISLARAADVLAIVPATANMIAKLACGLADDLLSTTCLATRAPILVAPAMNSSMYEHPATQANLQTLRDRGVYVHDPAAGRLACGEVGAGKLAPVEQILTSILHLLEIGARRDYAGKHVVVTAGPTREAIDPVRYISNHSSGKMGYAIAQAAKARGARVTLITGPVNLPAPGGIDVISVQTAQQMLDALLGVYDDCDMVIKAAAPADFAPEKVHEQKVKKKDTGDTWELMLTENPDILRTLGERKRHQKLVGFAAETQNLLDNAMAKLERKNLDMIVANDVSDKSIGFHSDENAVTMCMRDGRRVPCEKASKEHIANVILDQALTL